MNDCPLISVIVPIYNVEPYLRRCLDSIVNQTYRNLEIILVDDGSPDRCPEICDEYAGKDSRIKVIHKENGGLSEARNVGIEAASGEYFSFVDSDDVVHSDFIKMLFMAISDSGKPMSVCMFQNFADNEPLIFQTKKNSQKTFDLNEAIKKYCSLTPEESTPLISCCTKLYHRSLFQSIRFPAGKIYEDAYVSYKLLDCANGVAFINIPLYGYYMRSDSIMGKKEEHSTIDVLKPYQEAIQYFSENKKENIAQLFYPPLMMRKIYRYWLANTQQKNTEDAKALLALAREDCRKMRKCGNIQLNVKMIFSVIVYFPFLYSLYRKIAPGSIGGR